MPSENSSIKNTSQNLSGQKKRYIRVIADMRPNMQIMPLKVIWEDGREFEITDILDIKRTIVKNLGEQCMAYHVKIKGVRRIIYLDKEMQWFLI